MGYTHYWYRKDQEFTPESWGAFRKDAVTILEHHKDIVCYEYDCPDDPPAVLPDMVKFNGKGEDGHETFVFERFVDRPRVRDGAQFFFCKTARKPYDEVVVDILSCARHRFGKLVKVSSDGDDARAGDAIPTFAKTRKKYKLNK